MMGRVQLNTRSSVDVAPDGSVTLSQVNRATQKAETIWLSTSEFMHLVRAHRDMFVRPTPEVTFPGEQDES